MKQRTEKLKAIYWSYEETDEQELYIYLSGITKKKKTIFVRIENFTPFVYLQLPKRVKWNPLKCKKVFDYFKERMKSDGPVAYKMYSRKLLHYNKKVNTIFFTFPTHYSSKKFNTICSRGNVSIPGVGTFSGTEFLVHEHNIDPILKFTSCRNIKLASWIEVKEKILEDEVDLLPKDRKFTSCDIDMYADWNDVSPCEAPADVLLPPKYCSFDIECYSVNHNSKLPDPEEPKNKVFQISLIYGHLGEPNRRKILLTLFDPLKIKGTEIRKFKTEKELLLAFTASIQEEDPDVFIGYNILKFDWGYMIVRSGKLGIYPRFAKVGRLLGQKAALQRVNWTSSAYGVQDFRYFDCHGRLQMDVLIEIERNFKLPKYSLDYVAGVFLNSGKEDVSPRQIFMLYQITEELLERCMKKVSLKELEEIKKIARKILSFRRTHGAVRKYREELLNATPDNILKLIRKAITIIGVYCVQDTDLPIDLVEKLNLMTTMEEMTNCMHIPMSYLHTRGQQIKVVAQVYRETLNDKVIIPYQRKDDKSKDDTKYQGAVVIEANPGDYDNVSTLDFAALYPTTMIAFNICYTTILEDDDPTPYSECHVIAWSTHKGCIAKNSKVTLSNRSKRIQNTSNQKLYAWNKKDGVEIYDQTNFFDQGVKKCIRLTFEDGTKLECTPDHRILSGNKWIEAQDLEIKQTVKMTYNPPEFIVPSNYEILFGDKIFKGESLIKLAQLIGLICTDGHMTKGRSKIYVGHKMDIQTVKTDLKELFNEDFPLYKQNYGWSFSILGKYGEAFRKLKGVNLKTKTAGRAIPDFVLQKECPEGIVCSFLSGMFGGDGHTISFSEKAGALTPIGFSWTSTFDHELEDVFNKLKTLLERVGLHPTISRYKKETQLRIPTNETLLFHEKIGFAHCVHKAIRLEAGCLYLRYRQNVWEQQKRIVEYVRNKRDISRKERKRYNLEKVIQEAKLREEVIFNEYYSSPTVTQMADLLRSRKKWNIPMFSRKHFPGPMEYMEKINARDLFSSKGDVVYSVHKDNDYLPTFDIPLIHKKSIGKRQTYDLEVKDSHSFIANGIIVHNCEHDPQKRKVKADEIRCEEHYYRFRKVKIVVHDNGEVEYLYQGIMPRLEQRLLTERKAVKKEMFKMQCRLKMQQGKCTNADIEQWRSFGFEIIEKGSLGPNEEKMLEVCINVLNAKQLALKVSANSAYGAMGARNGFIPLIPGAASITAKGRWMIMEAIERAKRGWPCTKLVYGDTDSCMLVFEGKTLEESFDLAEEVSVVVTHYLKCMIVGIEEDFKVQLQSTGEMIEINKVKKEDYSDLKKEDLIKVLEYEMVPIDLEFENMYGRFVLLTKKRYVAYVCNRKGENVSTTKKGVVLARRDNCAFLRNSYREIITSVLDNKSKNEIMNILYDRIQALFTRQIPDTDLIIYVGVKDIKEYAKKKETKELSSDENPFIDKNGDPIYEVQGPLDPRLEYRNIPQCLLALKMLRRGDDVPANTRLELLYLDNPDAEHQGDKAEDFTYYRENKDIENFKPDYLHYIEKQLTKPVTELFNVKYPPKPVIYEKIEDALDRVLKSLNDLQKHRVFQVRVFKKPKPGATEKTKSPQKTEKTKSPQKTEKTKSPQYYIFKGKAAKVEYVLESCRKAENGAAGEIKPWKYPELVEVCQKWKSRNILDRIYSQHGMKKRPSNRPSRSGDKLPPDYPVMLKRGMKGWSKGSIGKIIEVIEEGEGKNKTYKYNILMDKKKSIIINNVSREHVGPYIFKDGNLMKDILLARIHYKQVVEHLKDIFTVVKIVD
jgi:DNA polymerase elongation subunit (family B)/intein/homing endonuclease